MPNWCFTDVVVTGPQKELKKLYETMRDLQSTKEPLVPNGFGSNWYGCLVTALGEDWEKVKCRGKWDGLAFEGDHLTWFEEFAWYCGTEVYGLIERKFPGTKVLYFAEEDGMEICETNDIDHEFFMARFIVDSEKHGKEEFSTEKELLETVSKWYSKPFSSIDEFQEYVDNDEQEDWLCLRIVTFPDC